MSRTSWYARGQPASLRDLKFILDEKRAEKLKRSKFLRDQMRARFVAESDARKVAAALRRAVREQERQYRVTVRSIVKPLPGRDGKSRDRAFEAMVGLSPSARPSRRGRDGFSSFHFKVRSRGFGSRRQNRAHIFKTGETVRALRYMVRAVAREIADGGLVSNLSDDVEMLAGFFNALEEFERHDRANAMVYMSAVLSLPHELTAPQREDVLREVGAILERHDLGYVAVLHKPDVEGDVRNFHAHMLFSLRPVCAVGMGCFELSAEKHSDLNDATFLMPMREEIAQIFNRAMERAGHARRFTHLSDADRKMAPRTKASGKSTPGQKAVERKERDLKLMMEERGLREELGDKLAALKRYVTQVASLPVRDFAREAAERSREFAAIRERAERAKMAGAPVSGAKGQTRMPAATPTVSRPNWSAPDHRADPQRIAVIAGLVEDLGSVGYLPLVPKKDIGSDGPRFTIEPVDRFERRHDLFTQVERFESDPVLQELYAAHHRRTLDRAEQALTIGSDRARLPGEAVKADELDRQGDGLARAIFLLRDTEELLAMLRRVDEYWDAYRRDRARRAAATEASGAADRPTPIIDRQVPPLDRDNDLPPDTGRKPITR